MAFDQAQVTSSNAIRELKEATELNYSPQPLNMRLSVVRPPLVLVHGILSSSDAWSTFNKEFQRLFSKAFIYAPADYRDRSSSEFASIYTAVRDTVQKILGNLRRGNVPVDSFNPDKVLGLRRIAASRVNLLAHSQGGLATRFYIGQLEEFRRADNYFFGDLRRIITVGTPFKGAAIARWVLRDYHLVEIQPGEFQKQWFERNENDFIWQAAKSMGGKLGDMLAFRDLIPGSDIQRHFEAVRDADPTRLRGPQVHSIRAYAEGATPGLETNLWTLKFFGLGAKPLEANLSDQIVCMQSQIGAIPNNSRAVSEIFGFTHTQEAGSPDLRFRMDELLNQLDGVNQFDEGGMPPSGNVPDVSVEFTCK